MAPRSSRSNNSARSDRPEPEYSNPPVAEGINVSDKSPLRTFFINLAITTAGLIVLLGALNYTASFFARFVPFSWERSLVPESLIAGAPSEEHAERQNALNRLGARVAAAMELPEGMDVRIHYSPSSVMNAYAMLGGHIHIYQGLVDLMESEDELAMVIAHEMGHIKHRDALKGLLRAAGLMLLFTGLEDPGAYVQSVTSVGMATYSRGQERDADAAAVRALGKLYGHVGGAEAFFRTMASKMEGRDADVDKARMLPSILSTHPDTLDRIAGVKEEAEKRGIPLAGELTPLPEVFVGK